MLLLKLAVYHGIGAWSLIEVSRPTPDATEFTFFEKKRTRFLARAPLCYLEVAAHFGLHELDNFRCLLPVGSCDLLLGFGVQGCQAVQLQKSEDVGVHLANVTLNQLGSGFPFQYAGIDTLHLRSESLRQHVPVHDFKRLVGGGFDEAGTFGLARRGLR